MRSNHDVALVVRLRLTLYTAAGRSDRACEVCLEYLRGRGTAWSMHPTAEDASRQYAQVWTLLGDRQIDDLIELPLATVQDALDDLDVLCEVVSSALFMDVKLVALVICRMVSLSLQYGNCDASCYAYVWLGMLAGPQFGDYPSAFRFRKLGYDLVEQRGLRRYQARTHISFVAFIIPWTKHRKEARPLHQPCCDAAFRSGDLTYSAYTCNVLHTHLLATGDPLAEVPVTAIAGPCEPTSRKP